MYTSKILQFNDLVFDNGMVVKYEPGDIKFKRTTTPYSYSNGSYYADRKPLRSEFQLTVTIRLDMIKVPCEYRPYYNEFVLTQLSESGKLWRIHNNQIQWTNAYVDGISPIEPNNSNTLEYDVAFVCYEGVWHIADKLKTFLIPYDICEYMECLEYETEDSCSRLKDEALEQLIPCEQRFQPQPKKMEFCDCMDCDRVEKDMALCYANQDMLNTFQAYCGSSYRLVYNCLKAEQFFGDSVGKKYYTTSADSGVIAGIIKSHTIAPTREYSIILRGDLTNVQITVNGNTNIIKGTYKDIIIDGNGRATTGAGTPIPIDMWYTPDGYEYGFEFKNGKNRIMIANGSCCYFTASINIEELT